MFHVANLRVFEILGGKLMSTGSTLLVGWSEYLGADAETFCFFVALGASSSDDDADSLRFDVETVRFGGMLTFTGEPSARGLTA